MTVWNIISLLFVSHKCLLLFHISAQQLIIQYFFLFLSKMHLMHIHEIKSINGVFFRYFFNSLFDMLADVAFLFALETTYQWRRLSNLFSEIRNL